MGWKRRVEARHGGGNEAGEEGRSEADRTKEERKEGSEAGGRKEERVSPSNKARHSRRRISA